MTYRRKNFSTFGSVCTYLQERLLNHSHRLKDRRFVQPHFSSLAKVMTPYGNISNPADGICSHFLRRGFTKPNKILFNCATWSADARWLVLGRLCVCMLCIYVCTCLKYTVFILKMEYCISQALPQATLLCGRARHSRYTRCCPSPPTRSSTTTTAAALKKASPSPVRESVCYHTCIHTYIHLCSRSCRSEAVRQRSGDGGSEGPHPIL